MLPKTVKGYPTSLSARETCDDREKKSKRYDWLGTSTCTLETQMQENFHLAAIVKERTQTRLLQIPLHQALQGYLAESWEEQYLTFVEGIQEIAFNAGYSPEKQERFRLPDYELPDWLAGEHSQTIDNLDTITSDDELVDSIAGTVAMARNDKGEELVLFQNFTRSRVIRPGGFLFLDGNTYKSAERRGLTLDVALSAVYQPRERN